MSDTDNAGRATYIEQLQRLQHQTGLMFDMRPAAIDHFLNPETEAIGHLVRIELLDITESDRTLHRYLAQKIYTEHHLGHLPAFFTNYIWGVAAGWRTTKTYCYMQKCNKMVIMAHFVAPGTLAATTRVVGYLLYTPYIHNQQPTLAVDLFTFCVFRPYQSRGLGLRALRLLEQHIRITLPSLRYIILRPAVAAIEFWRHYAHYDGYYDEQPVPPLLRQSIPDFSADTFYKDLYPAQQAQVAT